MVPDQRNVSLSLPSDPIVEFERFRQECLSSDDPSLLTRDAVERLLRFVPADGCRVHVDEDVIRAYLSDKDYSKALNEASRPLAEGNGQIILPEWSSEFLDAFILVNAGPSAVPRSAKVEVLEKVPFKEKVSLGEIARGETGRHDIRQIETKPTRRRPELISLSAIDSAFVDANPRLPVRVNGLIVKPSKGAFGFILSDGRQSIHASMKKSSAKVPIEESVIDAVGHLVKTETEGGGTRISFSIHRLSKSKEGCRIPRKEINRQPLREYEWQPVLVDTREAFEEMVVNICRNPVISVDTETVGPTLLTQKAEVIGLGDPLGRRGYIVDLQAVEKGEIDRDSLSELLAAAQPRKVLHYAKFDRGVLQDRGFQLGPHEDTRIMGQRLVPEVYSFSLESLTRWLTDLGMSKDKAVQTGDWSCRPLSAEQQSYLCHDLEATWAVYECLRTVEEKAAVNIDSEAPELLLEEAWKALGAEIEGRGVPGKVVKDRNALLFHIKELLLDGALPYDNRDEFGMVYVKQGAVRSGNRGNLALNLIESMEKLQRVQHEFLTCLFDDRDSPLPVMIARINLIAAKLHPERVPSLYLRLNV